MRRATRPFVIEVRRGQKRSTPEVGAEEDPFNMDMLRRAEAALFGTPAPANPAAPAESALAASQPVMSQSAAPTGRILEALEQTSAAMPDRESEPRRRGRKPGSLNKPKADPGTRHLARDDAASRSVPLTPEVVDAALRAMAKNAAVTGRAPMRDTGQDEKRPAQVSSPVRAEAASPQRMQVDRRVWRDFTLGFMLPSRKKANGGTLRPFRLGRAGLSVQPKPWESWKRRSQPG